MDDLDLKSELVKESQVPWLVSKEVRYRWHSYTISATVLIYHTLAWRYMGSSKD